MPPLPWDVHKFGGTSLADADGYRNAAAIVERAGDARCAVVVSAMSGVTDALLELTRRAGSREASYSVALRDLRRRELELIGDLLPGTESERLITDVGADFHDIEDVLKAIWHIRTAPGRASDLIAGYGELWSARILASYLASRGQEATWIDAREVLTVEPGLLAPVLVRERSERALAARLDRCSARVLVLPGFIASTPDEIPTTLGRNGSDYSASIFASLLGARTITIWTDVDGVLSADPRRVPQPVLLDELSYDEAMELAYFGAKVIHPSTMAPAVDGDIPVFIRNTFNPEAPGTRIHRTSGRGELPVKGLATIDRMALVNLEGSGMIGVPGIAERLFGSLRQAGVSVAMISQGSSEHSICFAVPQAEADAARGAVEKAFFAELHHGQLEPPMVTTDCTVLAVVGDGMAGTAGIGGRLFGALGRAGVNVRAIAQGSSERNISIVIDGSDATRALRAVHAGFYLSDQTVSVGIVGTGLVGSTLMRQIAGQTEALREHSRIDLRVRALATSQRMLLDERQVDMAAWRGLLEASERTADLARLADHVQTDTIPHSVLVDCTADPAVAGEYLGWLERGIHVITPNKHANTMGLDYYRRLRDVDRGGRARYLYEATVGAGLPIVQTLRDLLGTGDRILRIEGVLSGTLSYLFNVLDGTRPFSEIVRDARSRGYTEPDPRQDLSGMDVARKVVILARESGLDLELDEIEVEGLVPPEMQSGSVDEFMERLGELDATIEARRAEARRRGEVLRFVGVVDPEGRSSAKLLSFAEDHPFARIRLTDNIVLFRTARYDENPLIVQGPGAGPEVTAGGVFADLLRLVAQLG